MNMFLFTIALIYKEIDVQKLWQCDMGAGKGVKLAKGLSDHSEGLLPMKLLFLVSFKKFTIHDKHKLIIFRYQSRKTKIFWGDFLLFIWKDLKLHLVTKLFSVQVGMWAIYPWSVTMEASLQWSPA